MNISEYKYKIETHAHTRPMSPCAHHSPADVVKFHSEAGYSAVTVTNHFCNYSFFDFNKQEIIDRFLKDYYDACEAGEKYGINVILGMEIRFPQNINDYLVYGINDNDISALYDYSQTDCATFYKEFKNDKNVILQAHPFRDGMERENIKNLDGIETFNMHFGQNSRIPKAVDYAKQFPNIITSCGTDFHANSQLGHGGILAKTLPKDSFELAELLKSHDYLFNVAGSIVIP